MTFLELRVAFLGLPYLSGVTLEESMRPYFTMDVPQLKRMRGSYEEIALIQGVIQLLKKGVIPELITRHSEGVAKVAAAMWQSTPISEGEYGEQS